MFTSRLLLPCVAILACSEPGSNSAQSGDTGLPVVADTPSLVIGTMEDDPDYQFVDVVAATRREDGTIVVADRGTSNIRFYDARGKLIRKVGRNGEGPGEFRMIGEFVALENGFLVRDWRLPRISILDNEGKFRRAAEDPEGPIVDDDNVMKGRSRFRYELLAPAGPYVLAVRLYHPGLRESRFPPNVVFRDTIKYVRLAIGSGDPAKLKVVDTVMTALAPPVATHIRQTPRGRRFHVAYTVPFTAWPDVLVADDRVYFADADSAIIRVFNEQDNEILTIRDTAKAPEPVAAEDRSALRQIMMGNNRDERGQPFAAAESHRWVNWYFNNMPFPEKKPVWGRMMLDGRNNIWMQDYSPTAGARRSDLINSRPGQQARWWTVFNSEGQRLGRIEMPNGLIVMEIGTDHVVGVSVDDMDVQTVVIYPFEPRSGEN